jgi:hypothetical protein
MNEITVTRNGQQVTITIKVSDTQLVSYVVMIAQSRKLEKDLNAINNG